MSLEHAMSTPLEAVGLQVWRGSLLMADYILYQGTQLLSNSVVLELGAGTGLVSIIAGLKAHHVYCTGQLSDGILYWWYLTAVFTDTGKRLLDLCQKNVDRNVEGYRNITVRELDWKKPFSETCKQQLESTFNLTIKSHFIPATGYRWSQDDMASLSKVSFILASDGIISTYFLCACS